MNSFGFLKFLSCTLFFFILATSLYANTADPVLVKGIIIGIDSKEICVKSSENDNLSFAIFKECVFVKNGELCDIMDFEIGEDVCCYLNSGREELLALVDRESCEAVSFTASEDGAWLPAIEKVFFGQRFTLKGNIQTVSREKRTLTVLTDSGEEKKLHIMKNVSVFDRENDYNLVDFSWDEFPPGVFIEVMGYIKEGQELKVFCIEKGKPGFSDNMKPVTKTFRGVITFVKPDSSTIGIESEAGEELEFKVTSDTIIFDWDRGEECFLEDLSSGSEIRVECIFSVDITGEAIVLEAGDPDLYY